MEKIQEKLDKLEKPMKLFNDKVNSINDIE